MKEEPIAKILLQLSVLKSDSENLSHLILILNSNTKYRYNIQSIFTCKKDGILLALPKLNINNNEIARTESVKFLGVLLDENLSWKTHVSYLQINSDFKKYRYII